ncbi:MAG: acyl-protein synthetase [Myxococcales bacterium]|nr:acyl-protein synthetase [Myxococcales bacterium]
MSVRSQLERRVRALIANPGTRKDAVRDRLIADIAVWQAAHIPEYGRLHRDGAWPPALPTDVFRVRRIAWHPPEEDARVFRSSGTTSSDRSTRVFRDLSLYDAAARAAAKHMLFPDVERMRLVLVVPHEEEAPDSSLSYMLTRFTEWFGTEHTWVWHDDALDIDRLETTLAQAVADGQAIALLGTSFAFVHAEDELGDLRIALPAGSRIMQTGGYKGRSREVDPAALRRTMSQRYGVPEPWIVAEYGMTELSSQMYETTLRDDLTGISSARRLWVPPWVRATPVDPDTLEPVQGALSGVLRIDDCASLDSVCCVQTSDLATRIEDGIVVKGRAPGAPPRGCSLAADEALGVS